MRVLRSDGNPVQADGTVVERCEVWLDDRSTVWLSVSMVQELLRERCKEEDVQLIIQWARVQYNIRVLPALLQEGSTGAIAVDFDEQARIEWVWVGGVRVVGWMVVGHVVGVE